MRIERLRRSQDFGACYARGRVGRSRYVVVHVRPNECEQTRVGFSVSKRLGKATRRNRVKRRLREIVREFSGQLASGVDVVIAARGVAAEARYNELRLGVAEALVRAGVLPGITGRGNQNWPRT